MLRGAADVAVGPRTTPEGLLTFENVGSATQRDRRRRILDATTALASSGGFEAVHMRAVAERADVALGTLYRYFPSKVHLLVSALAREFERANAEFESGPLPGDGAADRVTHVLSHTTAQLQRDPNLTEALTRAFMFADATVSREIEVVGRQVTLMLTRAMAPPGSPTPSAQEAEAAAIAKVIGDVWLAGIVQWVTGRAPADQVGESIEVAVRLLLPD